MVEKSEKLYRYKKSLEDKLYWKSLDIRPPYYDYLVDRVFRNPHIPQLLNHKDIRKHDESPRVFLASLKSMGWPSARSRIAVLGGGSCALIAQLLHHFDRHSRPVIHHYDKSTAMLRHDRFSDMKFQVDLTVPLTPQYSYDLVLSQGCLRYF